MSSSTTTPLSLADQLREEGRRRGLSPDQIEAALVRAGYAQPSSQAPSDGGFVRGAGLAARGLIQGAGNLADMTVNAPQALASRLVGGGPPPLGQSAPQGLPQPQTPGERVGVAAAEGAANAIPMGPMGMAGGALLGAGAGAAGQGMAEAGYGPIGQMAASAAVGMGIPVVGALGAEAIRSAIAGARSARQAAQQSAALLRAGDPNAALSLGQITEGGMARTLQGGMKNIPGSTEVFKENAATQARQMQGRANGIADQFSPGGTPMTAGAAIQAGLEEGYIPRFKSVANKLYGRAFQVVPANTQMVPSRTVQLFVDMNQQGTAAGALRRQLENPRVAAIGEDLAQALQDSPQGIPFGVVKELRSRLGSILSGEDQVANINLRDVKRVYGALSEDMQTEIVKNGGANAWAKAESFWKQGTDKIENILQPLIDKRTPEKAFQAVMSGSREGATLLQGTMRSLQPAEQGIVRATVIREMGSANPGQQNAAGDMFSPETFLTNWNKIRPEAKGALFNGANPQTVKELDFLTKAIEVRKKAANVLPNAAGTAQNTAFFAALAGLSTSVGGALAGSPSVAMGGLAPGAAIGGANLTARIFTSPRMINWLVKQTRVPFGAMTQQLAILAKDSQKWPTEDQDIAQQVTSTLGNVDWPSVLLASAVVDQAH